MAKRRKKRASAAPAARGSTKIIRVPSAPAPIIKVSAPRAAPAKRRTRRRSSGIRHYAHRGAAMAGGLVTNDAVQTFIGGALYGFAVKSGLVAKLPAIPVIGRTGTAALLLGYWARHGGGPHVHNAARAAAAIAGYQLGETGSITGDLTTTGDFAMGDATTPGSVNADLDGYDYRE